MLLMYIIIAQLCLKAHHYNNSLNHLGKMFSNNNDGGKLDMKVKRAKYIDRNCAINQEF